MSEQSSNPETPEPSEPDSHSKPPANWLEAEVGHRHSAPMFYEDIPRGDRKLRKRDSREHKRASQKNRAAFRKRVRIWILSFLGLLVIGTVGFFAGREFPEDIPQPDVLSPVPFEATPTMLKEWNQAFEARAKGDIANALVQFEKIAKTTPDAPAIDFYVAEAAFKTRDFQKATSFAEQGIKNNNRRDLCQMILGLIAWQQRGGLSVSSSDETAIQLLTKAVAMNPSNPYPYYFIGELKRETGSDDEGNEFLSQAANRLDVLDSLIIVHMKSRLAEIQLKREKIRSGTIPDKIVKMEATQSDQRLLQALVYLYQGKTPEAIKAIQQAKAMLPEELFVVLISDPAFREFQIEPGMDQFFHKP